MLRKLKLTAMCICMLLPLGMSGCGSAEKNVTSSAGTVSESEISQKNEENTGEIGETSAPVLLYQGHASIRIVTAEGKVIYIDPYAGDGYDMAADLILVTHAHSDHNQIDKVTNRNDGCRVITQQDALKNGICQSFDLSFVNVEAVKIGGNKFHKDSECVGYILTFSNEKSVYVTGDTSISKQMSELAVKNIDYAFFCCDGVYNMGLEEAAECASMVDAKHSIPYHITTDSSGKIFDRELAEQFDVDNRLIVEPREEITIE